MVIADLDEPGFEDVIRKVMVDIETRSSAVTEADVRAKLSEFESMALEQIAAGTLA